MINALNPWLFITWSIPWIPDWLIHDPSLESPTVLHDTSLQSLTGYYMIHPLNPWLVITWSSPCIPDWLLHDPALESLTSYYRIHSLNPWQLHNLSLESLTALAITWTIPWIPDCYCLVKKFSFKISFFFFIFSSLKKLVFKLKVMQMFVLLFRLNYFIIKKQSVLTTLNVLFVRLY